MTSKDKIKSKAARQLMSMICKPFRVYIELLVDYLGRITMNSEINKKSINFIPIMILNSGFDTIPESNLYPYTIMDLIESIKGYNNKCYSLKMREYIRKLYNGKLKFDYGEYLRIKEIENSVLRKWIDFPELFRNKFGKYELIPYGNRNHTENLNNLINLIFDNHGDLSYTMDDNSMTVKYKCDEIGMDTYRKVVRKYDYFEGENFKYCSQDYYSRWENISDIRMSVITDCMSAILFEIFKNHKEWISTLNEINANQ